MAGNIITDEQYKDLCQGGFKESMVNELKQVVASINSRRGPGEEKLDYDDLKASLDFSNDYLFDGNLNMSDDNQREQVSREVLKGLERVQRVRETPSVWRGGLKKRKTNKRKTNRKRKTRKTKRRNYKK